MREIRYRPHPEVACRPDGDGAVLLHVGRGLYFELNPTARFVWEQMADGATVQELVHEVVRAYDALDDEARALIVELLGALERDGLVLREGEGRARRLWRRLRGR